jgi:N6-adenosine-specific RNA methylase IME4
MSDWPFGLLREHSHGVIYADPCWHFEGYNAAGSGVPQRADEQHYSTMTVQQLATLPVGRLAANDCALFMWSTSSHTPQAFWLADQWGFKFASKAFTWAKLNKNAELNHQNLINKALGSNADYWHDLVDEGVYDLSLGDDRHWFMGMGHSSRRNTEDCWLFTKGQPKRMDKGVRELIVAPVREHSRKPDAAYERIERLFRGPHCELFARSSRAGWSSWGNETDKFE